jgi:uncharacterized protein YecE (DUF72 family)
MSSDAISEIAQVLPESIYFGTSSWNYEGWKGNVYRKDYSSDKAFKEQSLVEYAQYPLFRTVGIDSSFYAPLRVATLTRYASQVPSDFRWVAKVWEEITIPFFGRHRRYGEKAGRPNPNFLNSSLFEEKILTLLRDPRVRPHVGPLVLQFQLFPNASFVSTVNDFILKLRSFLASISKDFLLAIEIRNAEILAHPSYVPLLNEFGVAHCFNHWTSMPSLHDQMRMIAKHGGVRSPFLIARLLTPLGVTYEQAVRRYSPYREIQLPQLGAREDAVRLALRALDRQVPAFVIVNNRLEGNAPGTIRDIARLLVDKLHGHREKSSNDI